MENPNTRPVAEADDDERHPPVTNRLDDDVAEQGWYGDRDVPPADRQTGGRRGSKRLRTDPEVRQSER